MALLIKKNPNGVLMARKEPGPDIFLLSKTRRVSNRKSFEVRHYLAPETGMVVFALNGVSTSLMHKADNCRDNQFGLAGRRQGQHKPVWYEGLVFLVFTEIRNSEYCFFANKDSRCLSGSNTFPDGHLCLGTALDPLTPSALDAFCFHRANTDLQWQGPALDGAWEFNPDPEKPRLNRTAAVNQIFKVTSWPSWRELSKPIPPSIIADCEAW